MPSFEGVYWGQVNGRGEGGEPDSCGPFHEFPPGPDGWCDSCRPSPDDPILVAGIKWWMDQGHGKPKYGSRAYLDALIAWDKAGRPGNPDKPKKSAA